MQLLKSTKLFIFIFITSSLLLNELDAQAYYGDLDKKLQIGVSGYGYGKGFSGSFDKGINNYISVGAGADLYLEEDRTNDTNFYLFGRLNGHLGEYLKLPLKMDLYPGVSLGITADGLGYGVYGGVRYFFNETFGVYAELGNQGRLGLSINL